MSDEEFMANISKVETKELFEALESFGCDSYYRDLWQCVLDELKRRMEAKNVPTAEQANIHRSIYDSDSNAFIEII